MINWTWANSDENQEGKILLISFMSFVLIFSFIDLKARCDRLRELGIEDKLKFMEKDSSRDVRDRASTALNQLREVLEKIDSD